MPRTPLFRCRLLWGPEWIEPAEEVTVIDMTRPMRRPAPASASAIAGHRRIGFVPHRPRDASQ